MCQPRWFCMERPAASRGCCYHRHRYRCWMVDWLEVDNSISSGARHPSVHSSLSSIEGLGARAFHLFGFFSILTPPMRYSIIDSNTKLAQSDPAIRFTSAIVALIESVGEADAGASRSESWCTHGSPSHPYHFTVLSCLLTVYSTFPKFVRMAKIRNGLYRV